MLSRVLRAKPSSLTGVLSHRALHMSAVRRADFIQDLYSQEIKSFKPRTLSDKDAEGSVLKWTAPAAPKVPGEEINVADLDSYAGAAVEVEGSASSAGAEGESATGGDWFPIENFDAQESHH